MQRRILKSFFVIIITILISSCSAYHGGYLTNSASLSSGNFSYVKMNVKGTSTTTYVIGVGGIAKETLVNNAKQDLLTSNPLQNNQDLVNLTVNFKTSYYLGIVITVKCLVAADIVEFKLPKTNIETNNSNSKENKHNINNNIEKQDSSKTENDQFLRIDKKQKAKDNEPPKEKKNTAATIVVGVIIAGILIVGLFFK